MQKDELPPLGLPASAVICPQTGSDGWERDCDFWNSAQQRPLSMRVWRSSEKRSLDFFLPRDPKRVDRFYDRLQTGEVIAFGVPEPMPPSGGYVEIDPGRWAVLRIFDWMESTAIGGGAVYHLCQFYRRADVDAWRLANAQKKEPVIEARRTHKKIVAAEIDSPNLQDPGWRSKRGATAELARKIACDLGEPDKAASIEATIRRIR